MSKNIQNNFLKEKNNKYYSIFQPGSIFVLIPFYLSGKIISLFSPNQYKEKIIQIFISLMPDVFTALILLLIFLIIKKYNFHEKILVHIFLLYFATIMPFYNNANFNEPLQTFLLLFSVYLIFLYKTDQEKFFVLLAGFLLGFAICVRFDSLPFSFLIILFSIYYFYKSRKIINIVYLLLSFIVMIIFLFIYYYLISGKLLVLRADVDPGLKIILNFKSLILLLFGPNYGFFIYQPIFFFIIIYLIKKFRIIIQNFICIVSLSIFVLNILFLSILQNFHGGWNWGPRLLYKTIPFMLILFLIYYKNEEKNHFILFLVPSIFINLLGLLYGVGGGFLFCVKNNLIRMYYSQYIPIYSTIEMNIRFFIMDLINKKMLLHNIDLSEYKRIEPLLFRFKFGPILFLLFFIFIIYFLKKIQIDQK